MLEFASLFLGLVWGIQPIEMVVGDPQIVRLELRLDGRREAILAGPPWKATVDFGHLEPHRFEVIGLDREGKELARAEQWINVPRPPAEARLVVEEDERGRKTHAVLKWESVSGQPPAKVEVYFDGMRLPAAKAERFAIPPADPAEVHFLTAELAFPDGTTAHAEASFGGRFGDQVETELTAFPVRVLVEGADTEPLFGCLDGRDGRPLRVAQVERGPAEVVFVRDRGAEDLLLRLRSQVINAGMPSLRDVRRRRPLNDRDTLRFDMQLEEPDRVRFVWPNVIGAEHPTYANAWVFESSPFLTTRDGGLFYFLAFLYPDKPDGWQHLADALALSGLHASAEGRRRAAVLVLGDRKPVDRSRQTPAAVHAFLQRLDVPLHVWSAARAGKSAKDWPPARSIGNVEAVRKAVEALRQDLDSQRIVWIAGRYLASEIVMAKSRCPDFAPLSPALFHPADRAAQ
jgi:hypothetical protein